MKRLWIMLIVALVAAIAVWLSFMARQPTGPAATPVDKGLYVAMGDSVAAGLGLATDSDSSACDRTDESYPRRIASVLHYHLSNIACSQATLEQGIRGSQTVNNLALAPQLEVLFTKHPTLITMTVGANDVGWLELLGKCYQGQCGSEADQMLFEARRDSMSTDLQAALRSIRDHYAVMPALLVVGYYQLFPGQSASCTDLTGVDTNELAWGRRMQADLNQSLSDAVAEAGAGKYVGLDFSGHELCSQDPWIQGLTEKAPYHPNVAGQTAIAHRIETILKQGKTP